MSAPENITMDELIAEMQRIVEPTNDPNRFTRADLQMVLEKAGLGGSPSTAVNYLHRAIDMGRVRYSGRVKKVDVCGRVASVPSYTFVFGKRKPTK